MTSLKSDNKTDDPSWYWKVLQNLNAYVRDWIIKVYNLNGEICLQLTSEMLIVF